MHIRRRRPEDLWSPEDQPWTNETAYREPAQLAFTPPVVTEVLLATSREAATPSAFVVSVVPAPQGSLAPAAEPPSALNTPTDDEPQVASAAMSRPRPALVPTDTYASLQWHLDAVNVAGVWENYSGRSVRVGIIDDGFDHYHSDLDGRYNRTNDYDVRNRDSDAYASTLGDNHGTAVMGVIASEMNGAGTVGVAHNAMVTGVRMGFGADGSLLQIRDALARMVGVDVANCSWGFDAPFADSFGSTAFSGIAMALQDNAARGRGGLGTSMVFAAGNSGEAGDDANAHDLTNSPFTIAVGATDQNGMPSAFSTQGACILVSAPGEWIATTDRRGGLGYLADDYVAMDGTSFAAPIVTGVIALMLEANRNLGYRDVQEILAYSAQQPATVLDWNTNGAGDWNGGGLLINDAMGFGLVDAHAAVRLAETWTAKSIYANRAVATVSSNPTRAPLEIADLGSVEDSLTLSGTGIEIDRVELYLNLSHGWVGDLVVTLTSPSGTVSEFIGNLQNGAYGGTSVRFMMDSVQFWGEQADGNWTLTVEDNQEGDAGLLTGWSMQVMGDRLLGNDTYVYTNAFATLGAQPLRATLADAVGIDAVNFAAVASDVVFDLALGGTVGEAPLLVAEGTVLENAFTGDGNDVLIGNAAANWLRGGRGADTLSGGVGNDRLWGEQGADVLTGGLGRDSFVYRSMAEIGDVITDFQDNGDRLEVGQLLRSVGYTGTNPFGAGWLRQAVNSETGNLMLQIDADGTKAVQPWQTVVELHGVSSPILQLNWDVFLV